MNDPTNIVRLSKGFRDLIDAGRLAPATIRILTRLARFVPGRPHTSTAMFQSFEDACPCLKVKQVTFEKLLCLAVMVYCNLAFSQSSIGLQPTLAFCARRNMLIKEIVTIQSVVPVEEPCMLWMFMVSIRSCMDKKGRMSPEGQTLLSEARHRDPSLLWTEVETILNRFQWNSGLSQDLQHFFETNCDGETGL